MIAGALSTVFEVRLFEDSPALLEALSFEQPEALVLDWHVPELSGLEVLRIVRLTHDELSLPVLILTASDNSQADLLEALEAGANDFATKPFADAELKARISTLVRVRLLHDRARHAEQQHERARKALEERADFEQQLIGIVSHDLRTPVGAIALGAAILARDVKLSEQQTNVAKRILSSAGRASRMIRDLLDFTAVRFGQGLPMNPLPVQLHDLAQRVLMEVSMANPDRQIDLRQTGEATGIWDADRIAQALVNLTTNALHYSPADSRVSVDIGSDENWAVLGVRNEGPPIPADLMCRLFLPMQRGSNEASSSRSSVGLGLFIVDSIVRAHHGSIEVQSSVAEGTTFTMRLPRSASVAR